MTRTRKEGAKGVGLIAIAVLLCAFTLCASFLAPSASAATQDDDLVIGTVGLDAGSALLAQAEPPANWNYIVNEKGQRFFTLQAAIDAAKGKATTITLNDGDHFKSYGNAIIRGGKNVTIQAGNASATFTGIRIDINSGSLTIAGTSKNRIRISANIETYNAAVTFKHCDIYRPFEQNKGSLRLENCKVIDYNFAADRTSKATIALKGNATCSLKDTQIDGDIYVGKGCAVTEIDSSTIANAGLRTANGITVEGGGALRSVKNSTVLAAESAIELRDGSTGPTIENSNLLGFHKSEITVKGTVSNLKVEPSLEGSAKGMGSGGYYTKVNTTNPIWTMPSVVPKGYQLSRWQKSGNITIARGVEGTYKVRYLVRTDCSVTYDANGGSGNMSSSNRKGQWADMGIPVAYNKFTCEGAKFIGWNTKKDGTGKAYKPGQTLKFDSQYQVTLYAQWDNPQYTVTFDSMGGSAVSAQRVRKGGLVKRPKDPTREGYIFLGWYTDRECTWKYDFNNYTVTKDRTIYARWKPTKCTVSYQTNGGKPVAPQMVDWNSKANPYYGTISRPHYTLEAWCIDPELTKPFDFSTPITSDMTLYAKWGGYELCHGWDAGVVAQPQTCTKDEITTYTCKVDPGQAHTESFVTKKARGHSISQEESNITPATCTTEGKNLIVSKCACGLALKSSTEVIAPLGHNWGEWTKVPAPTETSEGLERHTCTREGCNAYEDRKVPKKSHEHAMEKVPAVAATCSETGNVEYWVCSGCWKWFKEESAETEILDSDATVDEGGIVVPKIAHTEARRTENERPSTCTAEGSHDEVTYCSVCDEELDRTTVSDPLLDHTPGEPYREDGPAATCESSGYHHMLTKCTACGQILSGEFVEDPAISHVWDDGRIAVYPTCLTPGVRVYSCKHDKSHAKTEVIAALGHKPGKAVWEKVHESDGCLDDAFHDEVVYCQTCGAELSRKHVVDGHPGHKEGKPIVTIEKPSCTDEGRKITIVKCETCGHELSHKETTIPALGHNPGKESRENEVAPTCLRSGSYDLVVRCTRTECKEELWRMTVIEPTLGHDWSKWKTVTPATEDSEGLQKHVCAHCGKEETRTLPKLNHAHSLKRVGATEATCVKEGTIEYWECNCGAAFFDKQGKREILDVDDILVDRKSHVGGAPIRTDVVPATCAAEGSHNEVVRCKECDTLLSTKKVIDPVIDHAENDMVTEVIEDGRPTCEDEGSHVVITYCAECDEILEWSETIQPALGHEADEEGSLYENVKEPTCTEGGSYDEVLYCTRCYEELYRITNTEDALGHDWGEWSTVTQPTETSKGRAERTCNWCDEKQYRVLPEIGHVHKLEHVAATEATCTEEGNVEFWTCVDCGWSFYDAAGNFDVDDEADLIIPKTEHVRARSVDENIVEPTCTEEGLHDEVIRCLNCNQVLSTMGVTDQAKGHVPSEPQHEVLLEASCEEGGVDCEFTTCTTCGEELTIQDVETEPTGHVPGDPVRENVVKPTADADGSYDKVVYCTVCKKELSREKVVLPATGVEYLVVQGDRATWVQGSESADQGLRFVIKRSKGDDQTFSHFLGIRVDNKPVSESGYTAKSGSVVITLLPSLLGTLSEGDHTMTALFDDGAGVDASFTVKKPEDEPENDNPEEDEPDEGDPEEDSGEKASNKKLSGDRVSSNTTATRGPAKTPATGDGPLGTVCSALLMLAMATFAFSVFALRR